MWKRVWFGVHLLVGVAMIVLALDTPLLSGQMIPELHAQAQLAGCQPVAVGQPDINWNQPTVGITVFWGIPPTELPGTCVASVDGNVVQFSVLPNSSFQNNAGVAAFASQLWNCRDMVSSTLPGLDRNQLNLNSTAYPQPDGSYVILWSAPDALTGTCIVSRDGMVFRLTVN